MTGIERILQLKHFLLYNFLFWVVFCTLDVVRILSFTINFESSFELIHIIRWPLSSYFSYWILSYFIFDMYIRSRRLKGKYFFLYHFISSILFGVIHKVLTGTMGLLLERLFLEQETKTWREILLIWEKTYFDIVGDIIIYWLVILILIGLDFYKKFNDQNLKRLELESELGKSQLKSMKMQMNPHFLFNAFNTIAMMIRQKKDDEAINMIGGLSDMFRLSLNKELKQFVPLKDEVELLKNYLSIESLRYKDRLTINWQIDENSLNYEVPNFILQPIVENAFKHGIAKTLNKAALKISVRKENERLVLEVFNTGSGLSPNWELQRDKGIGLSNTIDRLLKLYNEEFKFLINEKDDGVSVILKLPIKD